MPQELHLSKYNITARGEGGDAGTVLLIKSPFNSQVWHLQNLDGF